MWIAGGKGGVRVCPEHAGTEKKIRNVYAKLDEKSYLSNELSA